MRHVIVPGPVAILAVLAANGDKSAPWGYLSQDAYDNARSRMDFEGATVTGATYADFLAWHAKAEAAFKPVGQIRSLWGFSNQLTNGPTLSTSCSFFVRTAVFAAGKPALTAEWERRGKPEFWIIAEGKKTDGMAVPEFWDRFKGQNIMTNHPQPRTKGGGIGTILSYSRRVRGESTITGTTCFQPMTPTRSCRFRYRSHRRPP